jgi:2,3-bisphosphoglycerate-dependent phosphoglycerate mutase
MKLILVRHGQSAWNLENRFTGWVDVDLTPQGEQEAALAGKRLKEAGINIGKCFVSPLKRAKRTAEIIQKNCGSSFPIVETPEVIERFYGGLTGLNKAETTQEYGEEQVHVWRRSYDIAPPALPLSDERHPSHNPAYKSFPFTLPATESLKDVVERVKPFLNNVLLPSLNASTAVLVAAHGNSIRAIYKEIKHLDEDAIQHVEIATGTPIIFTFDAGHTLTNVETLSLEANPAQKSA